jgi:hypothetical protein
MPIRYADLHIAQTVHGNKGIDRVLSKRLCRSADVRSL